MDFEKYYKIDRDGNYTLHFVNKNALTISEIKSIFSEFGNVMNVSATKDERGFRFVKYKTLEETKCCLRGLQDGSKIQLLPEKSKLDINKRDCSQQGSRTPNSIYNENSSKIRESHIHTRTSNRNGKPDNFSGNNYTPNDRKSSLSSEQQTCKESNFSDATKNYELFYKWITQDNTYMVHFINKRGLGLEEIKEFFSRHGDVLSVHCGGGNNNGLRFVKYQTLDEVLRCIKGFENNDLITLLPQKNKMGDTSTTNQGSLNQRQASKTGDAAQNMFRTGKQFNSNFIHNGLDKTSENGEPINKMKTSHWNSEGFDNFSDTASHSSRQENTSNGNKYRNNRNIGPQMSNRKYSFSKQQNPVNNETYEQQETKSFPSIKNDECIKMDRNTRISTNDKIPALVSNREMKPKESDAMSDCSSLNGTSSFKIVIPMQEIIVANIHTKYGIHYILHLFEKHCPISATLVKTIADTNIRYCHVYFKTVDDAIAVEEEFDNFDLSGKNLIVLRKSRFIDETICK